MEQIILHLISGAIGGQVAASFARNQTMSTLVVSLAGIIGGGLGGQVLVVIAGTAALANMDLSSIFAQIVGAGSGGAILYTLLSMAKRKLT